MPFKNQPIDIAVCVGSVINYCDAALTIAEFGRVLRKEGTLILEFDGSGVYYKESVCSMCGHCGDILL